ncbi:FKBP-type peptidyl-prolyl cis-trans isomerase [Salmonella enterica]|nr:FKBP-type peptidyl-prolyl cis-trans isomerase [Salmonella enterica]
MLMLAGTQAEAAEGDMPEVLRYAREYTRDRANPPALQPEVSQARKLARSELIRRQQRARIEVLEKQLKSRGEGSPQADGKTQEDMTRLTRELDVSAEAVRTLTQKLSQAQQEKKALQAAGDAALQQAQTALKDKEGEAARLTAALATLRTRVAGLEKEKAAQAKALQRLPAEVSLKTAADRQAYAAGVMYARDVREARDGNRMLGITLDAAALHAGLNDALTDEQSLRLDKDTLAAATQALEKNAAEAFRAVTARQKQQADAWLKTFRKEKGTARDAAGFWYRVTWAGDGDVLKADDTVDVVVEERLPDGKVVSDMDRAGSSLRQRVADFPPVFAAGLLRLKNHGQITLAVPPELAYGDRGYPPDVPPGAMMIYHIRVSDVIPAGPDNAAGRGQE